MVYNIYKKETSQHIDNQYVFFNLTQKKYAKLSFGLQNSVDLWSTNQ